LSQWDYIVLRDLSRAIETYAPTISGRILDYGCGVKPYAPMFRRSASYEGADFRTNKDIEWILDGDGRLPPDLSATFDAVVSFQVLEHVRNVSLYLRECQRVLCGGGQLLLTTHGIWDYHPHPHDFFRWTMEGLKLVVEEHGFGELECKGVTLRFRSILQQIQILLRGRRLLGGARLLRVALNGLADMFGGLHCSTSDARSLAICYLIHARKLES
jgi:SAM-dependent methyltransferase